MAGDSTGNSMNRATHESFTREEIVVPGSDRSFGMVMAAALAVLAVLNAWRGGRLWPWLTGLAGLLLAVAVLHPASLNPLNRGWLKFGLLLQKVTSPILLGVVFYATVLPTGLIMRALGKNLLLLKRQPDAGSYWIGRQPPGPAAETMKDQF